MKRIFVLIFATVLVEQAWAQHLVTNNLEYFAIIDNQRNLSTSHKVSLTAAFKSRENQNVKDVQNDIENQEDNYEWVSYTKQVNEYDDNGYQTQQIIYNWKNGWTESSKISYEYDSDGNQIQQIHYSWNNEWKESLRYTYEYDNNGNQIQQISYSWNDGLDH